MQRQGFLFSALIALIAAAAAITLLRLLIRPLNRVADAIVRYRKGEKDIALPVASPDEIGVLAREFAGMIKQKGEEEWAKENLVAISRSLLGFKELSGFAASVMEVLTPTVGAQVGVLYISGSFARQHTASETETLTFLGGWGYKAPDGESLPRSFKWGEGVVGSCARTRTRMLVTDIPEDYLRIVTALGETKPRQLLLLPVLFENTLVGVIELATVGTFSDVHLAFLEQLSFNIGVIINSISAGMRTLELLEETRQTAEELQRSEEELKTQQEELEASNEEMEEKTKALEEQNARIRQQSRELEETKRLIEDKANELELSNRYKSEFLANMSHELRTPLNSLLILARGLSLNEEGNLTPEQVEEAHVIHNGGLELLSLINDILDLSKVEAGKISITPEDIHLSDVMKKLSQQFQPVAQELGVAFHVRRDESLPETLRTDGQRLEQILKNLLSNAFKFTQIGSVTLDIHRVTSGADAAARLADSAASDRLFGDRHWYRHRKIQAQRYLRGFPAGGRLHRSPLWRHRARPDHRAQICAFAGRRNPRLQRKRPGQHLHAVLCRLRHCREVCRPGREFRPLPRGRMRWAETVIRPCQRPAMTIFIPDDRNIIGANDNVLLVIEDDRDFCGTLMKIARKRGYKCLAAGDGKSGLLLATEQPVSAIILDLRLPDIDGMRVLDQLKHDLKTRHIPVHIITGVETADSMAPLRKGAIGYRIKPLPQEDLDKVFTLIESKSCVRPSRRVLVVEDDKTTQTAIQSLLKQKDCRDRHDRHRLRSTGAIAGYVVRLHHSRSEITGYDGVRVA